MIPTPDTGYLIPDLMQQKRYFYGHSTGILKKTAAILLLSLLAFNWYGYRLISAVLEKHAEISIEVQLDNNNYDEQELIAFTIPLNLPYQTNWKDFERFDGEVEIDGITYKYVKRKVQDGKLIVLCIPNKTKMGLQTSRDEFFKLVNDLQHPQSGKKSENSNQQKSFKSLTTEYYQNFSTWSYTVRFSGINNITNTTEPRIVTGFVTICEQPPDACIV